MDLIFQDYFNGFIITLINILLSSILMVSLYNLYYAHYVRNASLMNKFIFYLNLFMLLYLYTAVTVYIVKTY